MADFTERPDIKINNAGRGVLPDDERRIEQCGVGCLDVDRLLAGLIDRVMRADPQIIHQRFCPRDKVFLDVYINLVLVLLA